MKKARNVPSLLTLPLCLRLPIQLRIADPSEVLGGAELFVPIAHQLLLTLELNQASGLQVDSRFEEILALPFQCRRFLQNMDQIDEGMRLVRHDDDIVLPKASTQVDYEAELAFVIGKRCKNVKAADWQDVVFGYTIVHDVSARDYQLATSQWTIGKTFDTFGPMGPTLVSKDEIPDPHDLRISLELNGKTLQDSSTKQFVFDIPYLVEYLSTVMTLEAGDVVSTGTPPGVGFARKPPIFLQPGDVAVVKIEELGELRNRCVAES